MSTSEMNPGHCRQSRIPAALQAVFLASNRGKDVHKPPPEKVANKVFFGNWLFQRKPTYAKTNNASTIETETNSQPFNEPFLFLSPQVYLDAMLRSRGYSTKRYETLSTAYYNEPSPLQKASYNVHLIDLIRSNNVKTFREIMSCGISPNPCNGFGESIVHTVCRRSRKELLDILIENGCELQVTDDYGRTPLHDACWAAEPAFEVVREILKADVRMFHMIDARGHVPLDYVRKEHWSNWISFLEANKETLWPKRDIAKDGEQGPPPLTLKERNSRPIPVPNNALTLELASMVAAGRMKPHEVIYLNSERRDVTTTTEYDPDETSYYTIDDSDFDSYNSDDDDSDSDSDDDSDCDSEFSDVLEEEEMKTLLASLPCIKR